MEDLSKLSPEEYQAKKEEMLERVLGKKADDANAQEKNIADDFIKGLKDVGNAVKQLHPKEKSALDAQLDEFLTGGNKAKIEQAKNKFINMSPAERAKLQAQNPELFKAMFPKEAVAKPDNYDKLLAEVKADPTKVNKLPYNIKNYAYMLDVEGKKVVENALKFMNFTNGVTNTKNPLFDGKYQGK